MTRYILSCICVILSTAVTAAEFNEAGIQSFMSAYEKALGTEDFNNVARFIHPQAIFRFSEGDFVGLVQIEKAFEKTWALDVQDVEYFLTNVHVLNLDATSATVLFNWNWHGKSKEGPFQIVGRGTSQIVLFEGQSKLLLEHLSR
ncbi:MAG: DUF4440 domain-containing protein [Pseudomonadales bacterium]